MSARRFDLAGTGSMVVDLICSTPRFIGEDEKILLEGRAPEPVVRRLVGGVTLNHLGWASLLGVRCAIFGKQADDPEGRFLRAGMERLGIACELDLSGSASSFAHVYVASDGGRAIYMARGATGELTPEEIEDRHAGVIRSAGLVSSEVSQVPLATVLRVLELARADNARTVVDLDVPLSDAVPKLGSERELALVLEQADVIKCSLSAAASLVPGTGPEEIAPQLAERYRCDIVALTLGADGAALWAGGELLREPAPSVEVVDTTGAGDALLGGLLAGLHHQLAWSDTLKLGVACAAASCERLGGFPDDPDVCYERIRLLYRGAGGTALPERAPLGAGGAGDAGQATAHFLEAAAREVSRLAGRADVKTLQAAAELIRRAEADGGRVHVTGVGKPEHVARYAAALLASTGTPASFLHGTEASHGSVGQLRSGDVLIAISNSGETAELLDCVRAARALDVRLIGVTSRADSPLARESDLVLIGAVDDEGGPLGLAPRTSVLAQTILLQALSVELQSGRGFSRADYARRHPAGALGKTSRS